MSESEERTVNAGIEPLPCPFYGCTDVAVDLDTESVTCRRCMATGPSMLKKDWPDEETMIAAAIAAWNHAVRIPRRKVVGEGERAAGVVETMRELSKLAHSVFQGTVTEEAAEAQRFGLCTKHGPAAVRGLDEYYQSELKLVKTLGGGAPS